MGVSILLFLVILLAQSLIHPTNGWTISSKRLSFQALQAFTRHQNQETRKQNHLPPPPPKNIQNKIASSQPTPLKKNKDKLSPEKDNLVSKNEVATKPTGESVQYQPLIKFGIENLFYPIAHNITLQRKETIDTRVKELESTFLLCKNSSLSLLQRVLKPILRQQLAFYAYRPELNSANFRQTAQVSSLLFYPETPSEKDQESQQIVLLHPKVWELYGKCLLSMVKQLSIPSNITTISSFNDTALPCLLEGLKGWEYLQRQYLQHLNHTTAITTSSLPANISTLATDPTTSTTFPPQPVLSITLSVHHEIQRHQFLQEYRVMVRRTVHSLLRTLSLSTAQTVLQQSISSRSYRPHTWAEVYENVEQDEGRKAVVEQVTNALLEVPQRKHKDWLAVMLSSWQSTNTTLSCTLPLFGSQQSITSYRGYLQDSVLRYSHWLSRLDCLGHTLRHLANTNTTTATAAARTTTTSLIRGAREEVDVIASHLFPLPVNNSVLLSPAQYTIEDVNDALRLCSKYSFQQILFDVFDRLKASLLQPPEGQQDEEEERLVPNAESVEHLLQGMYASVLKEHIAGAMKTLPPASPAIPEVFIPLLTYKYK